MTTKGKHGGSRPHPPGRKYGRPPKAEHLKAVRCGFITLPAWIVDWLKTQPQPWSKVVEKALIDTYGLESPAQSDSTSGS